MFLAGFIAITLIADESPYLCAAVPGCSLFIAVIALISGGGSVVLLPAALIFLLSVFKQRFFCRWMCPAGSCFELAGKGVTGGNWMEKVPRLGSWLLFVGVGAAIIGFPLFIVFDPLAIFSAAFGWVRDELTLWEKAGALVFPLMVVVAVVAKGLWCGRVCPLGALQDFVALPVIWIGAGVSLVGGCSEEMGLRKHKTFDSGRRLFIGLGVGAGYRLFLNPVNTGCKCAPIRPPAIRGEAIFTRLCVRCGACARACPGQIIRQSGFESGFAGLLAPEIDFTRGECPPTCIRCGQACPSGAIPKFTEAKKYDRPMGLAKVNMRTCLLAVDHECGVCLNACPHHALEIKWDPVNMTSTLIVDKARCTGCGTCQYVCPVEPVAIVVCALR